MELSAEAIVQPDHANIFLSSRIVEPYAKNLANTVMSVQRLLCTQNEVELRDQEVYFCLIP